MTENKLNSVIFFVLNVYFALKSSKMLSPRETLSGMDHMFNKKRNLIVTPKIRSTILNIMKNVVLNLLIL